MLNQIKTNIMPHVSWFEKFADTTDIESWFDYETFDWRDYSWCLSKYCTKDFNKWWNEDKFNWIDVDSLFDYCCDYRHIWLKNKSGRDYWFEELRGNHGFLPIVKV